MVEGDDVLQLARSVTVDVRSVPVTLEDKGELLAGYEYDDCVEFADWLLIQRERCRNGQRSALAANADALESDGQLDAALEAARHLTQTEPESEAARRRVMRLCHLLGDRASALREFKSCQQMMRRLCDSEVSDETFALAEQIRRGPALRAPERFVRREIPLAVERPPVLVGRERAWAQMEAAWAQGTSICLRSRRATQ